MMRSIGKLGDHLLNTLVPKATAAACVPPAQWTEDSNLADCHCRDCHYNCYGAAICGPWHAGCCG